MAPGKKPAQLDEWGNPILPGENSGGKPLSRADQFDRNTPGDEWDDPVFSPQKAKEPRNAGPGPGKKGLRIVAVLAVVLLLIGAVDALTRPKAGKPGPEDGNKTVSAGIAAETPTERPQLTLMPRAAKTAAPTQAPTNTPRKTATPTQVLTRAPTNTPRPTAAPTSTPVRNQLPDTPYAQELRYYYQQLSGREKDLFTLLYNGIMKFEQSIDVESGGYTAEEMERVCFVLYNDTPELFQFEKYVYWSSSLGILTSIDPTYSMAEPEYRQRWTRIRQIAAGLGILPGSVQSEYEREYVIYRYIIEHCHYVRNGTTTSRADSVLCDGRAQCAGYARAFSLLCRLSGINCLDVTSQALDHEWNIININGKWYICDVTWDDGRADEYQREFIPGENAFLSYLNLPERLAWKHRPEGEIVERGFRCPACSSLDDNYVYREGIYAAGSREDIKRILKYQLDYLIAAGRRKFMIMVDDQYAFLDLQKLLPSSVKERSCKIWNVESGRETYSAFLEIQ